MINWYPNTCGCVFVIKDSNMESVKKKCDLHMYLSDDEAFFQAVQINKLAQVILADQETENGE